MIQDVKRAEGPAAVPDMASEAAPALRLQGVAVAYGRRRILEGVALAVAPGEVYALLGRNGSGKSSLVRCLLGQQRPAVGRVELLGRDAWRDRAALMREVGVVAEEPQAPPELDARRLSRLCGGVHGRWDGAGVGERLRRLGVPLDLPFRRLSRGQKRQVELALALGHRPRMLVLDDPSLGLDPLARRALFQEVIGALADTGVTVLLTSHDLAAVEGIADRVGILHRGRLLLDEELERLKGRYRRLCWRGRSAASAAAGAVGPVVRRAWGAEAVVDDFGSTPVPPDAEAVAMSLEEIFTAVVGEEAP
ncbi:MAG TPA: ATP-binding cassette domain-containing protein [Thermoanaerobaculia bacterium]|nr:ATP-binding cassette domain-containing protein [Thermoanaerobaculia bacterium]